AVGRASKLLSEATEIDSSWPFIYVARALWRSAFNRHWDEAEEEDYRAGDRSRGVLMKAVTQTALGSYLIRRGKLYCGARELPQPRLELFLNPLIWVCQADA